ncbi:tetratricopeptide repeat protein [Ramlibacter sp. AN1015]|uniref:tetratricopeptide repeat protein n=1 Tax=Ramlibacter sp. AN1015 TaxID=3133428 RepID=UPI0030C4E4BF
MSSTFDQARAAFQQGVQHFEAGRLEPAEAEFARALELVPQRPSALTNLGVVRVRLGRFDAALAPLQQALAQEPDNLEALSHRAIALAELGRPEEALRDADRALAVSPSLGRIWGLRGKLLKELGRAREAASALERAIALGSEVELNAFVLAGLRGDAAPATPPRVYVESLFDGYAAQFDGHLVEVLQYRAPQRLLEPLTREPRRFARALDLGCGTGLCGPWLRALAQHVTGVDLSAGMLARAAQGGHYDTLEQADLVEHLRTASGAWDLVVAADVFIYVGALAPVFAALAQAMPADGLLCFSLEESRDAPLVLRPSLRYAHSEASVLALAREHGFEIERCERGPIRHDQGTPIDGLYFRLARR